MYAIGYFDCVRFGFLRSEHVRLRARISVSAKEMRKVTKEMLTKYEMLFKTDTVCAKADAKNQMLKNLNMIY